MPAVRDISWSFESTTSDAGISVPMPAYEPGDLLLAFINVDTGTPTISSSSWASVFSRTNTCNYTVLRKIASGSEPNSCFFSGSVNETYNGAIISIRDVDQLNPINTYNDTTQASAAKYSFQSITTTRDKCLLIFACASSVAGVPSVIEGPVVGILGADGAAESQGIGWGFQHFSGTTTTSVSSSNVTAGAGVKAVIAINPPTGTTPVIPTYCVNDLSVYINPINGTTAYNGNAAFASTADTLFTTNISGTTAVDPSALTAVADVGLNTFHSVGQITTVSNASTWAGATIDLSAGNNINTSGRNILVHAAPSSPGQAQRFPNVSNARKGLAFGMLSSANNWKIWYTFAGGTSWGANRDVPIIINSDNTSGLLASSGTFSPTTTDAFGFWVSSTGVSTIAWQFYSMWMLNTTTVAGGTSNEPVDIRGIYTAVASGHERRSAILQGVKQLLLLQPIQLGNGSTNPIYMDLDGTAIEFPEQYNLSTKNINYCSVDNVAGITYYPGDLDTIKHRNSIISSPSKFHWDFHPSSSISGTYDFSGLSVIGAGRITLNQNVPLVSVTFSKCDTIIHKRNQFVSCSVLSSNATASCTTNDPSNIKYCTFVSSGSGHALQIMATGTFTLEGNVFSGYGLDNTTDSAIYNASSGSVTLNVTKGATPTVRNGTSSTTTINNNVSITLTGLQNPSEVRVYTANTTTELVGSETVITGEYTFSVSQGSTIDISILSLGYQNMRITNYNAASDTTLPVSQQIDRQYNNS